MGHANVDGQGRLWTITKQLTQADTPTIVTGSDERTLQVKEEAVEVHQNPFPYDGLFVVLHDPTTDKEFSLLVPENDTLSSRLVSPTDAHGEPVSCIKTDAHIITGTTANDLGIPLQ
jgi:hypothetical protein